MMLIIVLEEARGKRKAEREWKFAYKVSEHGRLVAG